MDTLTKELMKSDCGFTKAEIRSIACNIINSNVYTTICQNISQPETWKRSFLSEKATNNAETRLI